LSLDPLGSQYPTTRGLDFLLCANMWTLLNHEAFEDGILDKCAAEGISVIVGGPFSSGILATGADPASGQVPYFNYMPASDATRERCRKIEGICRKVGLCTNSHLTCFLSYHDVTTLVV